MIATCRRCGEPVRRKLTDPHGWEHAPNAVRTCRRAPVPVTAVPHTHPAYADPRVTYWSKRSAAELHTALAND